MANDWLGGDDLIALNMSSAIPKKVAIAWRDIKLRIGDLELPPFTLGKFMLLHDLKSPLLDAKAPITLRDLAVGLVVMSRPVIESRDLLQDADEWDRAIHYVADQVPSADMFGLGKRLVQHIDSGFATAVKMGYPAGGGSPFPPGPPASPDAVGASPSPTASVTSTDGQATTSKTESASPESSATTPQSANGMEWKRSGPVTTSPTGSERPSTK